MKCQYCFTELHNGSYRAIEIDGVQYVFCPVSYAPLSTDCLNEYLLRHKYQEEMLTRRVQATRSIH